MLLPNDFQSLKIEKKYRNNTSNNTKNIRTNILDKIMEEYILDGDKQSKLYNTDSVEFKIIPNCDLKNGLDLLFMALDKIKIGNMNNENNSLNEKNIDISFDRLSKERSSSPSSINKIEKLFEGPMLKLINNINANDYYNLKTNFKNLNIYVKTNQNLDKINNLNYYYSLNQITSVLNMKKMVARDIRSKLSEIEMNLYCVSGHIMYIDKNNTIKKSNKPQWLINKYGLNSLLMTYKNDPIPILFRFYINVVLDVILEEDITILNKINKKFKKQIHNQNIEFNDAFEYNKRKYKYQQAIISYNNNKIIFGNNYYITKRDEQIKNNLAYVNTYKQNMYLLILNKKDLLNYINKPYEKKKELIYNLNKKNEELIKTLKDIKIKYEKLMELKSINENIIDKNELKDLLNNIKVIEIKISDNNNNIDEYNMGNIYDKYYNDINKNKNLKIQNYNNLYKLYMNHLGKLYIDNNTLCLSNNEQSSISEEIKNIKSLTSLLDEVYETNKEVKENGDLDTPLLDITDDSNENFMNEFIIILNESEFKLENNLHLNESYSYFNKFTNSELNNYLNERYNSIISYNDNKDLKIRDILNNKTIKINIKDKKFINKLKANLKKSFCEKKFKIPVNKKKHSIYEIPIEYINGYMNYLTYDNLDINQKFNYKIKLQ